MSYWWVNQNQTFRQEVAGGYLWSPKRKSNGHKNPYYEFMREVSPGDFVFSFEGTFIRAIGVVKSYAYESPKPSEFGNTGPNWNAIGWRVDINFVPLENQIHPASHMLEIQSLLPQKYSPIQASGRGNQSVYLTTVPLVMAEMLVRLIGNQAAQIVNMANVVAEPTLHRELEPIVKGLVEWEEHLVRSIWDSQDLSNTESEAIVMARRGQGTFKKNVMAIESHCRVTKVDRIEHLRASHIKPWRDCQNSEERLAAGNGLLLTPTVDHLFDRGFISFESSGELLISPVAHKSSLQRMGVVTDQTINVGTFNSEQKEFMEFHREDVFLQARIN